MSIDEHWTDGVRRYLAGCYDPGTGGWTSTPAGAVTLYGTCYALMSRRWLGERSPLTPLTRDFILGGQDAATGYFIGPELRSWSPPAGSTHDREHLMLHLTCSAVLPVLNEHGLEPGAPLHCARAFLGPDFLLAWLERRDLRAAWLEGNNILFAGQLILYMRDHGEPERGAQALRIWFEWLDRSIDPATGLWGSDRGCSTFEAMCGGYHQLLLYYYEKYPIRYPQALVDTTLALQHSDGGFALELGGGACEEVDAVDILVNLYKLHDYRRPDIRRSLRRCLRLLLSLQNPDGGFPYSATRAASHMNLPGTHSPPGGSATFPTFFRLHTLALIAQILTDEPAFQGRELGFNIAPSMGWHRSWDLAFHALTAADRNAERISALRAAPRRLARRSRSLAGRIYRGIQP